MTAPYRRLAVFGRPQTPGLAEPIAQLLDAVRLALPQAEVFVEAETAESAGSALGRSTRSTVSRFTFDSLPESLDLALVLGGDGTMIGVARRLACHNIPLVGINLGRLGFMTDLDIHHLSDQLPRLLQGGGSLEQRGMLDVAVLRRSPSTQTMQPVFQATAFNDCVISRGAVSRMVELDVFVDGHYMQTLRADGLIVSTPTGSTAYALSASGSILHPQLAAVILVPVAPQALSARPIVLPWQSEVTVVVNDGAGTELHCDMQALTALEDGDRIVIRPAADQVTLLHPDGYDYFSVLRRKLHWSSNPTHAGRPDPLFPAETS